MTVAELAAELGVSVRRARALCAAGRIEGAQKLGRDWIIRTPWRMTPGVPGRPPKVPAS